MNDEVKIEELPLHLDPRGWVFEPLDPAGLAGWGNAHLVLSQPGAVRGNHYHVIGTEVVAVVGPALVRYRRGDELRDVLVAENAAVRFTFPPGIAHAIQNTGSRATPMIAFNTEVHDRSNPDVVREELIPPGEPTRGGA